MQSQSAEFSALTQSHSALLDLCLRLEEIADSLPHPDRQLCLHAARMLPPLVARAHKVEEDVLFPALMRDAALLTDMPATLDRLRLEHCEDECFAEEVQDELLALGRGDAHLVLEATGYMLRGFFEGLRRHIAQERLLLDALVERSRVPLRQAH